MSIACLPGAIFAIQRYPAAVTRQTGCPNRPPKAGALCCMPRPKYWFAAKAKANVILSLACSLNVVIQACLGNKF